MKTWEVVLKGLVQGVGLRPSLFKTAQENHIFIYVANTHQGVKFIFNATDEQQAQRYLQLFLQHISPTAQISSVSIAPTTFQEIKENKIYYPSASTHYVAITPDRAWCERCKQEFFDPANRRHSFYFNSCADCGARYSVITRLPFEREHTTMNAYTMCEACHQEYDDFAHNRRAFTQLISCEKCNYTSSLFGSETASVAEQLELIHQSIQRGEIILLKGIGGFLLATDDKNIDSIRQLRILKHRKSKPFAIMGQDVEWVGEHFEMNDTERQALSSSANPIVLLKARSSYLKYQTMQALSGASIYVGVMLASNPYLFELCVRNKGSILATSGNLSSFPIEFDNAVAVERFMHHTQRIWYYDRAIIFPQDDSVIRYSPHFHHPIILRRSRGLSPSLPSLHQLYVEKPTLCLGAENKSTVCLAYKDQILLSQYIGTLTNIENLERLRYIVQRLIDMTNIQPEILVIDQHPDFSYRNIIAQLPLKKEITIVEVQHHRAHLVALLAEKKMLHTQEKILGVVFDGVGYGNKKILGGEFFIYQHHSITEHFSLPSFRYLQGNQMSVTPALCYFSIMQGDIPSSLSAHFNERDMENLKKTLPSQIETDSVGRVVDAFAFIVGFSKKTQDFEGETSIYLEQFLDEAFGTYTIDFEESYTLEDGWQWKHLFQAILADIELGQEKSKICFKFLNTLVALILQYAAQHQVQAIACTGGVFQNMYLVDILKARTLKRGYTLLLHEVLSPNDENISFGQAIFVNERFHTEEGKTD